MRLLLPAAMLGFLLASPASVRAGEEPASAVAFEQGLTTFDAVLAKAKEAKKPAFLDFFSPT